jgi:hypothetical protein
MCYIQGKQTYGVDSSYRNLCKEKWLEINPGGYEDDFKLYYDSLSESDLRVRLFRLHCH